MTTYYICDKTATHTGSYIDEDGRNVYLRENAEPFTSRAAAEARAKQLDPEGDWAHIETHDPDQDILDDAEDYLPLTKGQALYLRHASIETTCRYLRGSEVIRGMDGPHPLLFTP